MSGRPRRIAVANDEEDRAFGPISAFPQSDSPESDRLPGSSISRLKHTDQNMSRIYARLNTGIGRLSPLCCRLARLAALFSLLVIVACTPMIHLESDFPSPAIDPLPLSAAVIYSDEFQGYTYRSPRGVEAIDVELGPAQIRLLDRILGALFSELSR